MHAFKFGVDDNMNLSEKTTKPGLHIDLKQIL